MDNNENPDEGDDTDTEMDVDTDVFSLLFGFNIASFAELQTRSMQQDDALTRNDDRKIDVISDQYDPVRFEHTQCPICITEFTSDDRVCELTCKHIFHEECIKQWGKYKPECALCRVRIPLCSAV